MSEQENTGEVKITKRFGIEGPWETVSLSEVEAESEPETITDPAKHSFKVLTSSKNNKWATPKEWFEYLDLEFGFTLDPCCEPETAKCKKYYTPAEDGLSHSWADEWVFMNPPYDQIKTWMKKAYAEAANGALVVCFVPARVDTDWWHRYATKADEIRYPKGRVTFEGAKAAAPFPVAIVIFRPRW